MIAAEKTPSVASAVEELLRSGVTAAAVLPSGEVGLFILTFGEGFDEFDFVQIATVDFLPIVAEA